jgi:hypothetical protein
MSFSVNETWHKNKAQYFVTAQKVPGHLEISKDF